MNIIKHCEQCIYSINDNCSIQYNIGEHLKDRKYYYCASFEDKNAVEAKRVENKSW